MTELRAPGAKSAGRAEVRALLGTLDSALQPFADLTSLRYVSKMPSLQICVATSLVVYKSSNCRSY